MYLKSPLAECMDGFKEKSNKQSDNLQNIFRKIYMIHERVPGKITILIHCL